MHSSGVATVMFTDLEASTDTTTRLGDEAAASLFASHDRIVREQLAAHGGRNVRSTGDGFLVLFDSARSAVACALAIQRELALHEAGVRVRIGLSAGEVQEGEDGALFGAAINLASRVMDRAGGGEVLVTDTVRQLVGTIPGTRFRDRGRVVLKGFPGRQRLYDVQPAGGPAPTRAPPRKRSAKPRRPIVAMALAAVAATVAAVAVTTRGDEAIDVVPNSVVILDPGKGRVVAQVPVGMRPAELAVAAGFVWVGNLGDNTVTRIGVRSLRVVGTDSFGIDLDGLGAGPSGVWVADDERSLARVIDPDFRKVARTYRIRSSTGGPYRVRPLAVTADAVWVSYGFGVARIDPDAKRIVARIALGNSPRSVAVGAGAVWVSDDQDGTVSRVDPATNDVIATIAVGEGAGGIVAGADGVWVALPLEDRVKRIDPATNAIAEVVHVAGGPAELALGAGALWVTSRRAGTLTRIDLRPARVSATIRLGQSPQGVAIAGGAVWVAVQAGAPAASPAPADRAADVLRVERPAVINSIDPAKAFGYDSFQYATCAPLLTYPDRPFPAGAERRPEVAREMPTLSDGGRTYTFRLRSGFRFSPPSNAPVTAAAFERALERLGHPSRDPSLAALISDVVGAPAYRAGRAKRIAGITARGNTLTVRLREPSTTLPARLASGYACAVPPNTPITVAEPVPTAGPYYFASYVPKRRLVLRRNPNYVGTRPARFREIDMNLDVTTAAATAAVLAGRADYVPTPPAGRLEELDRRYGAHSAAARTGHQRYFSSPSPLVHLFAFNRRRPLFAPRSARLAASAALDRAALAAVTAFPGDPAVPGRPTDQFVPFGLPGFRDAAIYPLDGPDPGVVARLGSGRRPRRAVLYTCSLPHCLQQARVARRDLAAVRIDLEVKAFAVSEMFERLFTPGEPWDLGISGWFPGYADGADFISGMFAPNVSGTSLPGNVPDPTLERRIRAATRLPDAARARAIARIDADLARSAAAAAISTSVTTDFFSDRIGCQVHQPIYGISLGALCVRR